MTYDMYEESKAQVAADGADITEFEDVDIKAFQEIAIPIQDQFAEKYRMQGYLDMVRKEGE